MNKMFPFPLIEGQEDLLPHDARYTAPSLRSSYVTAKRGFVQSTKIAENALTPLETVDVTKLLKLYQKRCIQRLSTFLTESRKMNSKVVEVFAKLKELEVDVTSIEVDKNYAEKITNRRKRPRGLRLEIKAKKNDTNYYGVVIVTPASVKLSLGSHSLGGGAPIYSMTYYRNLVVHDHYLTALVKGKEGMVGKRKWGF